MSELTNIEWRIMQLERQNRWLKGLMGASAVLMIVIVVGGAAVTADNQFTLRDAAGTTRISAGINGNNQSFFSLMDRNGKTVLVMGESASGHAMITVKDGRGTDRGRLGLDDDGKPFMAILDADGQTKRIVN
jgi:hypothetical protein